jgi:hypothetical protein
LTPFRVACALVLGLALNPAFLRGQTEPEGTPKPAEVPRKVQILPFGGARYGAPLGASLYGGVMAGRKNPAGYSGPVLLGEAGQDGMRISAGAGMVFLGSHRALLSVIRTWDDHGDVRADQTYVGPEIAVGMIAGFTLGYYWRIGDGGGKARILSLGSFIGL